MAILFDLDGTLLDTAPDFISAIETLRLQENLPPLTEQQLKYLPMAVGNGTAAIVEVGFNIPRNHPDNAIFCKRLVEVYQKNLGRYTKPFPGIETLLYNLEAKKIPWGVVTNKLHYLTEPLLVQQKLANRAACIVSGDTTPYSKPHPAPLLFASEQMGLDVQHCIYVGDAERDILAGKAAGMKTLLALFGYIENTTLAKQWGADHMIQHPDEILPWYEQWLR